MSEFYSELALYEIPSIANFNAHSPNKNTHLGRAVERLKCAVHRTNNFSSEHHFRARFLS